MYRYIQFNDEKIDSMLLMELADLVKTFTRDPEYNTEFRVHSYLNRLEKNVYVSHFWNHRPATIMKSGMKSDVFLRALGNYRFTDFERAVNYGYWANTTTIPQFAKQLFMMAEDLRIEELCKKERPGMIGEFSVRREVYLNYFETQMTVNLQRNLFLDALYNFTYIMMNADGPYFSLPAFNENIDPILPHYRMRLEKLFELTSTEDTVRECKQIVFMIEESVIKDMQNDYFHFPRIEIDVLEGLTYSDLIRKDPLQNDDVADEKATGEEEVSSEEMKTWHRETENPGLSFLQFDLDQGTQTDILADEAREGEAGDQALAVVQGSARKSSNKDYSDLEMLARENTESGDVGSPYGKENKAARALFLTPAPPKSQDILLYGQYREGVILYQKKLKNIIDRTLEHKKIEPRSNLHFGRLGKNLLDFYTADQPKLFYKKNEPSKEIDAVFSLLVDCSASMHDKMEETKRGIILFHEALKSVKVPHEVIGFWEDANETTENDQPNYFKEAIEYSSSLTRSAGPEIMQLAAEEDNRDGFAIRVIGRRLLQRSEKQKFLIVFSDGEPAAYNYDQNGIVDTHEAVIEARKKGIEVFNIFLSQAGVDDEQQKVFQNIYGNYSIVVPSIDMLPDLLFPLLKKLLFQSL